MLEYILFKLLVSDKFIDKCTFTKFITRVWKPKYIIIVKVYPIFSKQIDYINVQINNEISV